MDENVKETIGGLSCLGCSCLFELLSGAATLVVAALIVVLILRGC